MIEVGERVAGRDSLARAARAGALDDVWQDGELTLLLFYLFDWSST